MLAFQSFSGVSLAPVCHETFYPDLIRALWLVRMEPCASHGLPGVDHLRHLFFKRLGTTLQVHLCLPALLLQRLQPMNMLLCNRPLQPCLIRSPFLMLCYIPSDDRWPEAETAAGPTFRHVCQLLLVCSRISLLINEDTRASVGVLQI